MSWNNAVSRIVCLGVACCLFCFAVVGCTGGTQQLDENYMQSAEALGKERKAIFDRAQGDFSKVGPEDKAKLLKGFGGSESQAKAYWEHMKNPPSSGAPIGMEGKK